MLDVCDMNTVFVNYWISLEDLENVHSHRMEKTNYRATTACFRKFAVKDYILANDSKKLNDVIVSYCLMNTKLLQIFSEMQQ